MDSGAIRHGCTQRTSPAGTLACAEPAQHRRPAHAVGRDGAPVAHPPAHAPARGRRLCEYGDGEAAGDVPARARRAHVRAGHAQVVGPRRGAADAQGDRRGADLQRAVRVSADAAEHRGRAVAPGQPGRRREVRADRVRVLSAVLSISGVAWSREASGIEESGCFGGKFCVLGYVAEL